MYKTTKMMAVAILASAVLANTSTSAQAARQHEQHEQHKQEQQEYVSSLEGAITANSVGQKQYKYINHLDIRINNAQFNIVIKNSAGQVVSQQELDATVKAVKQVTINGVEVSADKQQNDSGGEIRADLDLVDVESITEIVIVVDLQTEQGVLENVRFVIPQGSVISLSVCPDGSGIDYEIAGCQETIKVEVNEEDVPEEILPPVEEPELYDLTINYIDIETGKPIGDSYNEELVQGQDWDVDHLNNEIEFDNYVYCYTNGELIGTNVQSDVVINVYYQHYEEHNIFIIYQTEDGTVLEEYKEFDVRKGTPYDVTDKANNFTIPGYELKEVTGDATSGTVEKDVYVYVIFVPIKQEQPKDEEPVIKPEEPQVPTAPQEPEVPQEPQEPTTPVEPQEPEEEKPLPPVIQEEPKEEPQEEPSGDVGQDDKEIPQFPTEEDMNTPKPPLDKEPVEEPKEEPVYKEDIDEIEPPKKEEPSLDGAKDYVEEQKPVQQEEPVQQDESDKPVTGINPIMAAIGTLLTGFGVKLGKKRR